MTTTPEKLQKLINTTLDKNAQFLGNLAGRWECEKEYESPLDYIEAFQKKMPKGLTIFKMSKRPFGFYFYLEDFPEGEYQFFCTRSNIGWKRIK